MLFIKYNIINNQLLLLILYIIKPALFQPMKMKYEVIKFVNVKLKIDFENNNDISRINQK